MLNKLLKRCMPWMDKGRWYHIRATTLGGISVLDHDTMLDVSVDGDQIVIDFNSDHVVSLIDYHVTTDFNASASGLGWYNAFFTPLREESNHLILNLTDLTNLDCRVNIWLFMR